MSFWKVPLQAIALRSTASRLYVPMENRQNFNDMPNVCGIAGNILVIGYDKDGADHDAVVYDVLRQCQDVNLKT